MCIEALKRAGLDYRYNKCIQFVSNVQLRVHLHIIMIIHGITFATPGF